MSLRDVQKYFWLTGDTGWRDDNGFFIEIERIIIFLPIFNQ